VSTLAEAKAVLGHLSAQISMHTDGCVQCTVARKPPLRCAERQAMDADAKRMQAEIATWFAPPADSVTLFDLAAGVS
jgi:hypothetical protein